MVKRIKRIRWKFVGGRLVSSAGEVITLSAAYQRQLWDENLHKQCKYILCDWTPSKQENDAEDISTVRTELKNIRRKG